MPKLLQIALYCHPCVYESYRFPLPEFTQVCASELVPIVPCSGNVEGLYSSYQSQPAFSKLGFNGPTSYCPHIKKAKTSAWSLPIESLTSLQLQDIPTSIILIVLDQFISCTTSEKYLIHLSVIEPCILTARPKNKLYSILRSQTGRLKLGYNPAKWTGSGHLRLIISQVQYDLINGFV